MTIFIYHDYVHHAAPLHRALAARGPIRGVNADDVIAGVLLKEMPRAFVIPGGASRYMAAKLVGVGNSAIKEYVARGGIYIGICGGAHYACRDIVWAPNTQHEIIAQHGLDLFNGTAACPIDEFAAPNSRDRANARIVNLDAKGTSVPTLYWAGARFVPHAGASFTIEATYSDLPDNPAAIISGTHGKGKWLLASPHIEYDADAVRLTTFDVADNKYADIAALGDSSALTLDLFHKLLNRLLA